MTEEWRPVVGYEGLYEVSDQGEVRSTDKVIVCRNGQRQRRRGATLSPFLTPNGRRTVHLWTAGKSKPRTVYTLVLEAFVGPRPEGMEACHGNGDATDDRLANLRWDTKSENTLDQVRHGVHAMSSRTQCRRGHPLVEPNLVPFRLKRGERECLACCRAKLNGAYARKQGRPFDVDAAANVHFATIAAVA